MTWNPLESSYIPIIYGIGAHVYYCNLHWESKRLMLGAVSNILLSFFLSFKKKHFIDQIQMTTTVILVKVD